ncbi:hypothetical protein [Streptomyces sp. AB3(2024)]|uniref:hypothetical protein n=1 Tax=Streptomyces sp. AB3(2024) TaxID=3317321 RepID=UPI0035A366BF
MVSDHATVTPDVAERYPALSTGQLVELNPPSGDWPTVAQDGPALFGEARTPIEACCEPR